MRYVGEECKRVSRTMQNCAAAMTRAGSFPISGEGVDPTRELSEWVTDARTGKDLGGQVVQALARR